MIYSGILFDFNGVLWWDGALVVEGWQRTARMLRGRPFTDGEILRLVHGRNNRDTIEYLMGRRISDAQADEIIAEREAFYRNLCLQQGAGFRLSPGAEELLDFLKTRGIPRTIATASKRENVDFFIKNLRLERWFDPAKIVFDDGIRPSKPAPDYYRDAAAMVELAPARCVVVEDAVSGIGSARAAGIGWVVGMRHAANVSLQEGEIRPDEWIDNLGELDRKRLFG
ncbi:MAG: HAD family hydrolase [Anaerolineales bacterium]